MSIGVFRSLSTHLIQMSRNDALNVSPALRYKGEPFVCFLALFTVQRHQVVDLLTMVAVPQTYKRDSWELAMSEEICCQCWSTRFWTTL